MIFPEMKQVFGGFAKLKKLIDVGIQWKARDGAY